MDKRDLAIVAPAPPDCGDCRDQVILANLAWLDAHGWVIDENRECMVAPNRDSGFGIDQLADRGLTPATR